LHSTDIDTTKKQDGVVLIAVVFAKPLELDFLPMLCLLLVGLIYVAYSY
jgi:hypothetical protein